jgi:O-antigen ligase
MKPQKTIETKSTSLGIFLWVLFSSLFYLYFPYIQNYSATPKWIFVSLICLGMLFFGKKTKIPWSVGISTWLLFVLLYLIQSYWSYNFWDAVVRTIPLLLAPMAVILLFRESQSVKEFYSKMALVLSVLITPILIITLVEILGLISADEYSHLATYQFRYAFGNRNQYAELLVLLVPLISTGIYYTQEKAKKIFLLTVIVLIYLTVTLLLNRASILVLFGIYPLFFLLFYLQKVKIKSRKLAYGGIFVSIFIGILVLASPLRKQIPIVRNLLETRYGSGNERVQIWSNSIDLWKQAPVFGKGSGDWKIEILNTPLGFTKAEDSTVFYQRAHNDFIQIAVENGLVGLILFLAFFIIAVFALFKSNVEKETKILLSAGIGGYLLLSNFSFPIEKIELLILLFLFFAPGFQRQLSDLKNSNSAKFSLALPIFASLVLSFSWLDNERKYFEYKSLGDELVLSEMNKDFYTIDPTTTPIYWEEGNIFYNKQQFEKALISYDKALKHNPNHAHVLNNLGSCHYALGEMKEAEAYFKRALTINPNFIESLMNYSSFLFNQGDIDGALNHILLIPNHKEPQNYPMFIQTIAKAKYNWMLEIHDEPLFVEFLKKTYDDDEFLYEISKKARISGECYEIELRNYLNANPIE